MNIYNIYYQSESTVEGKERGGAVHRDKGLLLAATFVVHRVKSRSSRSAPLVVPLSSR